tara:strand:- start:4289 stop:5638 length:1350 start_codon:yes stop_codon:yes gene_type:complete
MSTNVDDIASLSKKITKISKNSVGTTGFGAAVGVLSVCVITAIILGGLSLNESSSSATQNINKITANFDIGDPTNTGVSVNLVGDKYQVSLNYSNQDANSYIQYLDGVVQGLANKGGAGYGGVLTTTVAGVVSEIIRVESSTFAGTLGQDPGGGGQTNPAYISGLSVTDGSYHKGNLVSGDTTTNSVTSINSAIVGGDNHTVSDDFNSVIAGGRDSSIFEGSNSFIGGGDGNGVSSKFTAILGGKNLNTAPGGSWNHATLCGIGNDPTFYPWDKITSTHVNKGTCYRFAVGAGDLAGDQDLGFAVDDAGNLYFGNNSGGCSIFVQNTSFQYTAKSFTIQHPTVPNKWLRHGCLEGPEGGVYYRGKGEAPATIRLPDYATHIASDFTVQVTPIGSPRMMSASEVSPEGTFRVYGEGKFHWNAIGERVPLEVEPLKTDVRIHSMGPYSWSV